MPLVLPLTGTLSEQQNTYTHDFYVEGRSIITISAESTAFDPNISLLNHSGTIIADNDDCPGEGTASCIMRFALPEDGWYEIAVHSFDGRGYGEFTLTMSSIDVCSQTEPVAIVTGEMLNVREGPDTDYTVIGIVHEGDCLILKGRTVFNTWYFVRFDESRQGWLRADSGLELFWMDGELPIVEPP
jgi:uncharacterized protein YgiM (DUF1202 family)